MTIETQYDIGDKVFLSLSSMRGDNINGVYSAFYIQPSSDFPLQAVITGIHVEANISRTSYQQKRISYEVTIQSPAYSYDSYTTMGEAIDQGAFDEDKSHFMTISEVSPKEIYKSVEEMQLYINISFFREPRDNDGYKLRQSFIKEIMQNI